MGTVSCCFRPPTFMDDKFLSKSHACDDVLEWEMCAPPPLSSPHHQSFWGSHTRLGTSPIRSYYHGTIEREEAVKRLQERNLDGAFLLRQSSSQVV